MENNSSSNSNFDNPNSQNLSNNLNNETEDNLECYHNDNVVGGNNYNNYSGNKKLFEEIDNSGKTFEDESNEFAGEDILVIKY